MTLRTWAEPFCMTFWVMMMYHHTKFGCIQFSGLEGIFWTKVWPTNNLIPIYPPPPPYGITRHTLHIHCTHTHVCARSIWFSHTHWIFLLFPLVAAKKWTSIWIYVEMSYDFWGVRTCQIHFFNPIHYVLSVSPLGPGCNIVLHILFLCCTNLELSLVRA